MPPELALNEAALAQTQQAAAQFQLAANAPARGSYHLVYTASTGCDGGSGVNGRHNLANIRRLTGSLPVDYINTNFQSDKNWPGAGIPADFEGKPVPGNKIAHVARGGNDPTGGSQLGKDLLRHYNLSAFSHDVVLVYVTDSNDRRKDRVIRHFDNTFDGGFTNTVLSAVQSDRAQQVRRGAQRS